MHLVEFQCFLGSLNIGHHSNFSSGIHILFNSLNVPGTGMTSKLRHRELIAAWNGWRAGVADLAQKRLAPADRGPPLDELLSECCLAGLQARFLVPSHRFCLGRSLTIQEAESLPAVCSTASTGVHLHTPVLCAHVQGQRS